MKRIFVLFLLCSVTALGASGQSKKFQRKLVHVAGKPYADKVFECKRHPLPEKDFQLGDYQAKMTMNTDMGWYEYNVLKNGILVAQIKVYQTTIVKVIGIKNVQSFLEAVTEIKVHPKATIALTGISWMKEIAPYLKEVKDNETRYVVVYESITYNIIHNGITTISQAK